jgi:UrcA family protein
MNTFISLTSTAVLSLVVLNAAYADEGPKSLTVQFADLDLSKDEGAAALFNRIKGAAKQRWDDAARQAAVFRVHRIRPVQCCGQSRPSRAD